MHAALQGPGPLLHARALGQANDITSYSYRSILLSTNTDVSRYILVVDTSILAKSQCMHDLHVGHLLCTHTSTFAQIIFKCKYFKMYFSLSIHGRRLTLSPYVAYH
jgi:hypothetical protein